MRWVRLDGRQVLGAVRLPIPAPRLFASAIGSLKTASASWVARWLGRSELPRFDEFTRLRPATRALIAGLAGWIALVAVMSVAAVVWVEFSATTWSAWLSSPGARTKSLQSRSAATFDPMERRPLFSRNRQAQAVVPPAPEPPPPPAPTGLDTNITLRGVFISNGIAKAFLVSGQNPTGVWAKVNEEIQGWRVLAIEPNQVQLGGGGQQMTVQYSPGGG